MKHFSKLFKLFTLVMAMVAFGSSSAYANSKTYYSKAVVTSTGNGKVYVTKTQNENLTNDVFGETSEATNSGTSASQKFYLHAQPETGQKFDGWYTDEACTEGKVTQNPYTLTINATSTTQSEPTTSTIYAKFIEATEFYSSIITVSCVGEGGSVAVSTESGNEDFGTEKSASNLNDVEAAHTYYLQAKVTDEAVYRFVGWYSDEACENQISTKANYTYKVTAESMDEAAPTQFHAYAKFEVIPYYYSKVTATALGNGKVNVALKSTAGDYDATSEASQKVADKAEHTYYLKAEVEGDEIEFDGWFSDAECTEKLAEASSYTYKVTSTSLDEASATVFNVYAKFTPRDMYQVRNAGFEKWAAANEPGFGWNSFPSATGSMAGTGKGMSPNPEKVEGRNGGSAVRIFSKYAGMLGIGANANGNLTTGIVNMGSMTPKDASNHNFTDTELAGHYLIIAGQPDGVEFYTKYTKGEEGEYNGHAQFIIHDKYNYRDPEVEEEQEHKIATCGVDILESEDWVRNTGDISYLWDKDAAAATTKYLLINFTTNVIPGGSKGDELIIDDVRLIYNSELAKATIGENTVEFIDGAATIDAYYDAETLTLTSNGRAATIETSYNVETGVLTITVKGENISSETDNYHTYTIQFVPAKATMAIANGAEWGTFCAAFDVEIPAGVKAYTVDAVDENDVLQLTEVTETIPANTVVVLNGAPFSKDIFGVAATGTVETGMLTGVYEDTTAPVGSYVLQNQNDVNGFYLVENVQPTVKTNRAYLTVPAGSEAKAFYFNAQDVATAISKLNAETTSNAIYDLSGRRVQNAQKGIFIVNGKKVIK